MYESEGARSLDDGALPLCERHYESVRRICRSRLPAREVDDAVQETMLQYLLADHSRVVNPAAWLTSVALHVCAHMHRSRYRVVLTQIDDHLAAPGDDPSETATTRELLRRITAQLRPLDRHLLARVYFDDATYDEVGQELGITNAHARVLAYRARRRARRCVVADGAADIRRA